MKILSQVCALFPSSSLWFFLPLSVPSSPVPAQLAVGQSLETETNTGLLSQQLCKTLVVCLPCDVRKITSPAINCEDCEGNARMMHCLVQQRVGEVWGEGLRGGGATECHTTLESLC